MPLVPGYLHIVYILPTNVKCSSSDEYLLNDNYANYLQDDNKSSTDIRYLVC